MGKNENFLTLTTNISNWVARSAKLQRTCFVRQFVGCLLKRKCCFYDKNWARNGNFPGANEKIELMSLPISPIFFPIDLHRGQPLAKFAPNNSIWQEIRGLFLPANWKSSLFFDIVQLYLHRNLFFLGLPSIKNSSFLDRTVCRRTRVPQVACCYWEVAFFFTFFVVYHEMFRALYIWNFQNDQSFKKNSMWTSERTFKSVWCYPCLNSLTWYSGACFYRNCQNADYFTY